MNNNITILQKAGVFALVCAGVLALSAVWFMYKNISDQDVKTFTVQGKGEVEVKATKATIVANFMTETKDPKNAKLAIEEMSALSKKVFSELETAGVKKEDIKTGQFSQNEKYDYCYNYTNQRIALPEYCQKNPNEPKIIGYTVTQNFTVTVEDNKELVEKLLGLLPSLGSKNLQGPNWEVDNKKAIQEARELAVKEAKEKATGIANAIGKSLGDVTYYSENQGGGGNPVFFGKDMLMSARAEVAPAYSPVSVSEGTDKVTVNVDITYELE
jgi:hypothetical protein